jgi:ABC-type nitrate/sulfonate/bicarbonate transport system permease component
MTEETAELDVVSANNAGHRRAHPLTRLYLDYENVILGILGVATFLAAWEWAGTTLENGRLFFSAPSLVVATFARLISTGEIWNDIWVSFQEFAIGYLASIVVAIPLGIAMGWYRRLDALLDPLVSAFYATPRVALVPLIIIWFGIGIYSKIAVVFLGAVFQILITTIAGVRNLDESLIRAAHSFGASDRQIFLTVALPGSVPFILTGLKLAVGRALIGVVVGEMVAAEAGVGYMMTKAGATFQTSTVMVGVLIIAVFGMVSMGVLGRMEKRFQAWRPQRHTA